jgi:dTDP-4-amino-4,6-dideoxygalactose transaminase
MLVPFNIPQLAGKELEYIKEALANRHLSGDGFFSKQCHQWLQHGLGTGKALLTHSCTGALEMAAILLDLKPGDEVIMPSFTFVSTANAFVLRGAIPVFVDIRQDTLNIDETLIESAITPRTRAIVVVHYAGVACEMDRIMELARRHGLPVIEDAAHAILATYRGRQLGTIGHLAALSFHETKNLIAGECGALLVNAPEFARRAEIIREKGTNRAAFFRGEVDKYTWVDVGSSYLPSELQAAFLYAQFEKADEITSDRLRIWHRYHELLEPLEKHGFVRRPIVPDECGHNGHLYHVLVDSLAVRSALLPYLKQRGVAALFHYVPLHSAPAGVHLGRAAGPLPVTEQSSERLLRLPFWRGLTDEQMSYVVGLMEDFFRSEEHAASLPSRSKHSEVAETP